MKKRSKSSAPKVDPYLEGLVAKLVERLIRLEQKMDKVIVQMQSKSAQNPAAAQPPHKDRVLYEAVCADCSKVCEVPFKPTEARPVYCKECWARRKGGGAPSRPGMPVLTPVAVTPKLVNKSFLAQERGPSAGAPARAASKKAKKTKKTKKRKK
jgi:CxxC-x17-CxxC domain-containing protein